MNKPSPASIRELPPLDLGGVAARQGFGFQDHVAAAFCLDALLGTEPAEVWCETHDDITLILDDPAANVEFVQVKSGSVGQLWSIATLCSRDSGRTGTSIVERSLQQDRAVERSVFRFVTAQGFAKGLTVLSHPRQSEFRLEQKNEVAKAKESFLTKLGDFVSPNGNGADYWVDNVDLDQRHSLEAVRDRNLRVLRSVAEVRGEYLFVDQNEELYQSLLAKVSEAAAADPRTNRSAKRFTKADLEVWLAAGLQSIKQALTKGSSKVLDAKLNAAGLSENDVHEAQELMWRYRSEMLSQRYMAFDVRRLMEGEVMAILRRLRSDLDAGQIDEPGVAFHARCLRALEDLRGRLVAAVAAHHTQGFMYVLVSRCNHRFRRLA